MATNFKRDQRLDLNDHMIACGDCGVVRAAGRVECPVCHPRDQGTQPCRTEVFPFDGQTCLACRQRIDFTIDRPHEIPSLARAGYSIVFCGPCSTLFSRQPILLRNLLMAFHAQVTEKPELARLP
jgi:hypothetical protein